MNYNNLQKKVIKDNTVSKTGYRALFLLRMLIESPKTREEIIETFANDSVIGKDLSKDTVTNTVNALRFAGCLITRPNMRTDFRYVLVEHPFSVDISRQHVTYLQALRKGIISLGDWQLIESVNVLYKKIAQFVQNNDARNELLFNQPFANIDKKVMYDLVRYAKVKKTVSILYNSSQRGLEQVKFIPDFIQFENEKLYIWGYSFKYENIGYLRADKIKSVDVIDFSDNSNVLEEYFSKIPKVKYKLSGYAAYIFQEDRVQRIIEKQDDYIIVESLIYSEFNFIQKLLMYGCDCKILEPQEFKEKFIQEIKKIGSVYEENK